jgi:hypothetical protein
MKKQRLIRINYWIEINREDSGGEMGRIARQVKSGKYLLNFYDDGNIICTCKHGSLFPDNYKNGDKVCVHIQRFLTKKPTIVQKRALRELVDFVCQNCHRHEQEAGVLETHRIIRGNMGGQYTPNNILMICAECHRKIHSEEKGCQR